MKRLLAGALALILSAAASATTLNPIQLLNPAGSSSGQAIVSTGASSAPAWGGVGVNGIAALAANTVLANATGSSASPTAFAMPSCSTITSALNWTSGTGFTCGGSGLAPLASPTFTGTTTDANLIVSGTITPSQTSGIVGTTTNNNANAGSIGEYATNTTSGTSLTSATAANCTSVSLTAGDWDVSGVVVFSPGATTTVSSLTTEVTTTSATFSTSLHQDSLVTSFTTGAVQAIPVPVNRISIASTTTAFLVASAGFGVSTMSCNGMIRARRVR